MLDIGGRKSPNVDDQTMWKRGSLVKLDSKQERVQNLQLNHCGWTNAMHAVSNKHSGTLQKSKGLLVMHPFTININIKCLGCECHHTRLSFSFVFVQHSFIVCFRFLLLNTA